MMFALLELVRGLPGDLPLPYPLYPNLEVPTAKLTLVLAVLKSAHG